ncbi:hypothetical protein AMET1_1333 [Methanonatronarchaeum thermophilum]|uniref:DUF4878 domain-containing protein n=1 Tax=Methanonatronarchaeum thermophilum TaxID=1927129 RepID=A0A1Y3GAX4_9EURY|nr:hypothetical protein [Methanonatronarchaeum thermophilum]OUJ18417.1 hypothetical protein AMET1_1333 [Methanonatronarchaeum thermophilum]
MKKLLAILVVLAMICSVAAVSGCMDNNEFEDPEFTVESYFEAMNNEDAELLSQVFTEQVELSEEEAEMMIEQNQENNVEIELIEISDTQEIPEEQFGMEMKIVQSNVLVTEDGEESEEVMELPLIEEDGEYKIFPM